jgi:hypothetical protein
MEPHGLASLIQALGTELITVLTYSLSVLACWFR